MNIKRFRSIIAEICTKHKFSIAEYNALPDKVFVIGRDIIKNFDLVTPNRRDKSILRGSFIKKIDFANNSNILGTNHFKLEYSIPFLEKFFQEMNNYSNDDRDILSTFLFNNNDNNEILKKINVSGNIVFNILKNGSYDFRWAINFIVNNQELKKENTLLEYMPYILNKNHTSDDLRDCYYSLKKWINNIDTWNNLKTSIFPDFDEDKNPIKLAIENEETNVTIIKIDTQLYKEQYLPLYTNQKTFLNLKNLEDFVRLIVDNKYLLPGLHCMFINSKNEDLDTEIQFLVSFNDNKVKNTFIINELLAKTLPIYLSLSNDEVIENIRVFSENYDLSNSIEEMNLILKKNAKRKI